MSDDQDDNTNQNSSKVQQLRQKYARVAPSKAGEEICSFCGRGPDQINALVSKGSVRICDLCVNAAKANLPNE